MGMAKTVAEIAYWRMAGRSACRPDLHSMQIPSHDNAGMAGHTDLQPNEPLAKGSVPQMQFERHLVSGGILARRLKCPDE